MFNLWRLWLYMSSNAFLPIDVKPGIYLLLRNKASFAVIGIQMKVTPEPFPPFTSLVTLFQIVKKKN